MWKIYWASRRAAAGSASASHLASLICEARTQQALVEKARRAIVRFGQAQQDDAPARRVEFEGQIFGRAEVDHPAGPSKEKGRQ